MELSHKIKDNYKAIIHESQKDLYYMKYPCLVSL